MERKTICFKPYYRVECGICPCKDCTERHIGCHAECDDYKRWDDEHKEKRSERHKAVYMQKQADYMHRDSVVKYKRKMQQKKGK